MTAFIVNQFFFINTARAIANFAALAIVSLQGREPEFSTIVFSEFMGILSFIPFFFVATTTAKLPKRTFVPLILLYCWQCFGLWPLFSLGEIEDPGFLMTFASFYLIASLHNHFLRRSLFGDSWGRIPNNFFANYQFSFPRFVTLLPSSICLFAASLVGLVVSILIGVLVNQTAGYLVVQEGGLFIKHQIYQKEQQQVFLLGMAHIANQSFYEDVIAAIPEKETVILAEGVTDDQGKMSDSLNYVKVAKVLGIASQAESFTREDFPHAKIVAADIDFSDLPPELQESIRSLGRVFSGDFSDYDARTLTIDDRLFQQVLIKTRNEHLMNKFDQYQHQFKNIVIPWGAAHSADLHDRIVTRGYKLSHTKLVKVLGF